MSANHLAAQLRRLRSVRRIARERLEDPAPGTGMALKINDLCVNCDVCEPACPNQAIAQGETIYVIDPARCTECVGHFDEPQCVVVCPVECIDPDPAFPETNEQLLAKLARLQQQT